MDWEGHFILWSFIVALTLEGNFEASYRSGVVSASTTGISFHEVHGKDISLSQGSTVATRTIGYCYGITFSNRPVRVNERIHVKILSRHSGWFGNLKIGFTVSDPLNLSGFDCHNRNSYRRKAPFWLKDINVTYTMVGSVFFFYFNESSIMYGNEYEVMELFSWINITSDLWAALEVYGQTTSIQLLEISCSFSTCENGGTCTKDNEINILRCSCQHGYEGKTCEKQILCDSRPCKNGGACTQDETNGVFQCNCASGYSGLLCEEEITGRSEEVVEYIVVIGAVLGAILLIFIILAVLKILRSKRMNETGNSFFVRMH